MAIVAGDTCGFAFKAASGSPETATRRKSRKLATTSVANPASNLRIRKADMVRPQRQRWDANPGPDQQWPGPGNQLRRDKRDGASGRLQTPVEGVPREPGVARVGLDVGPLRVPCDELRLLVQRQGH